LTAETDIPHFKEAIVMATICDYCGWKTNEVKSGAGISETGIRINLKLTDPRDLNRDILKVIVVYHN
jgi:zinc finger protein